MKGRIHQFGGEGRGGNVSTDGPGRETNNSKREAERLFRVVRFFKAMSWKYILFYTVASLFVNKFFVVKVCLRSGGEVNDNYSLQYITVQQSK